MRRIALGLAIAVVVCLAGRAHAADIYDCYNGSSEQGGNRLTVNGIQTNQYAQQSFPAATVDVYLKGTTTHATIWQDAAGTVPLANPFSSSGHGVAFFCAADAHYDVRYSGTGISVPFTVSDIHLCFSCGGGGGSVGPGTPNQVSKFTSATNVGDSSGGPDDGVHVVPWLNGLSIENASLDKSRPNGAACTTTNLLVEYDGSTVGGTASVQTASLGSNKVVGVADQGAGCSGSVRIADHGFHACVFDNQTVIHDAVIASATSAGQCSDGGASVQGTQVVGRVASVNSGAGTVATVDWFTGDTQLTAGTITSCATGGGANAYYPGIGQVVSCDQYIKDDGAGGLTFNNPAYAGFSYKKQGPVPPATPANTRMDYMPTSVTTHSVKHPSTAGAAGQAEVVDTTSTDANGNTIDNMKWGTAGGGVEAQVSGLDNANCTGGVCPLINFVPGTGIAITNTSGGDVQIASSASASQIANPIAPTLTVGGTPGASTVTYVVQLCEDGSACTKHTQTSTATATTANATLSSSPITISAYADTVYGWRCANIYRTVGGPSQGLVGACVGKAFIDNGVAASAGSATNTNTTALIQTMNPTSGGCDYPSGSPQGVDGLPCSPNAYDSEFAHTFGTPGDANDGIWTTSINLSGTTAAWTQGMLSFATPVGTSTFKCLFKPFTSSTPYAFTALAWTTFGWNQGTNPSEVALALRESATGKMVFVGIETDSTEHRIITQTDAGPSGTGTLTGTTTATNVSVGTRITGTNPGSYRISNDGTTLHFWQSLTGATYTEVGTGTAVTSAFTTAPNQVGFCVQNNATGGTAIAEFDYLRKTQ